MINNIKQPTRILTVAPLVLITLSKILWMEDYSLGQPFLWSAYIAETILIFYLIVENKTIHWFYSVILGLIGLGNIGSFFKLVHWPYAGVMVLAGLLGSILMVPAFLYSAQNQKNKNNRNVFLILGLCILVQLVLAVLSVKLYNLPVLTYGKFLHYPIAAMCGTILLKNESENIGERNLILYLLVHSLFVIIKQTFHLLT